MSDLLPGEAVFAAIVEGGEPWGAVRTHRKLDARWRGIARRLLNSSTPLGVGYLHLSGVSSDGETFDVNGRRYELDPVGTILGTSDAAIVVADGANVAVTGAAIVAQVNADADRSVDAVLLTAGTGAEACVAFIPRSNVGDQSNFALAEAMANGAVSDGAMVDGDTPAEYRVARGLHTVLVADTVVGGLEAGYPIGAVDFAQRPDHLQVCCYTNTGAVKLLTGVIFQWVQVNNNRWVLEVVEPAPPVLAAGDVIHWSASVF